MERILNLHHRLLSCFLVIAFVLIGVSQTSAHGGTVIAQCAQILNAPPFDTMLTRADGQEYGDLNSDSMGAALLGIQCTRGRVIAYFLAAGWEIRGEDHHNPYVEVGPPSDRFKSDHVIAFCLPCGFPWRHIFYRCSAVAGVHLFRGRITHNNAGFNL